MTGQRSVNRKGFGARTTGPGTDELVKVSAADTTASFLASKIAAGTGISLATLNPGANEQLQISASTLASAMPQRINAGAFDAHAGNSITTLVQKSYGSGPGGQYVINSCIDFPAIWQVSQQWWDVETSPPPAWTSTQIRFRVHFYVEDTISLPGGYRFTLEAKRMQDGAVPNGAKTSVNVDYNLADSNAPRKRITAWSSALTLSGAVATDGIQLTLTRGTNPTSDESDSAYVKGIEVDWV